MPADLTRTGGRGLWLFSRSNDDPGKILAVAVTLCLVCSLLVAGSAVLLKPLQERNKNLAIREQIVTVAGYQPADADQVEQLFRQHIEPRILDIDTGAFDDDTDPATFDLRKAASNPATSRALAAAEDPARIRRRPDRLPVYLVREDGRISTAILPVYGYGLWSTLYGFLAIAGDGRTITGLTFYEHGETPGLGDFIADPGWQAKFHGKLAFDEQGTLRIGVTKGAGEAASADAGYQVDAVAGATLTSRGVHNLLRYWLGEQGFGPFLRRLQANGENA